MRDKFKPNKIITVATDAELQDLVARRRRKLAVRNTVISQRQFPTEIQDMFLKAYLLGITFQYAPAPFDIPFVDEVWADDDRFIGKFLSSDTCEFPEKERLIDLYFRVKMPDIARHFLR